jgi:MFS family permease
LPNLTPAGAETPNGELSLRIRTVHRGPIHHSPAAGSALHFEKGQMKNRSDIRRIFRALRYSNYRLFFIGQGISLIGSWMQAVAMSWLVYRLTDSAFLLGVTGFAGQIPSLFLSPFAGVLADRFDRRRMLIAVQTLFMIQAFALAFLVLFGSPGVWQIVALSGLAGLVNAFDLPVRQSFVVQMVEDKADLGNAIALNSMMFNGARLLGPSIAGLVIAAAGEGICFLLNAVSFLAVIGSLLAMKNVPPQPESKKTEVLGELKAGFAYAYGFVPIRSILLLLALVSLLGMSYAVLMPVFAKEILAGGPHTLGFLMGATGVGAVGGAFFLASRKSAAGIEKVIPAAAGVFGIGLIAMSQSRSFPLSLLFMAILGFGMMANMVACNTLIQTLVDDDKRGRVMALYGMSFMGVTPFGSLLAGSLASRIGAPNAALIGGACCIAGAAVFMRKLPDIRRIIRPILVQKGILAEVSTGMEAASELTAPPE